MVRFRLPMTAWRKLWCALLCVLMLSAPLFSAPQQVQAISTIVWPKEINILNKEYSTSNTSARPLDNSLGYVYWDASKYSGTVTAQLEIIAKTSASSSIVTAALYDETGATQVEQSKVTIGSANTITVLDGCAECNFSGDTIYDSLALDSNGYPVISYNNATSDYLMLIHCGNANCTSGNTISTVDNSRQVERHTSIQLNSSGYPVISYRDEGNGNLMLAVCSDANCSSSPTITTVDGCSSCTNNEDIGTYSQLRLTSANLPVITYISETDDDLHFVQCGNTTCTSGNTFVTLDGCSSGCDSNAAGGQWNSIVLDTASSNCNETTKNCPVISYSSGTPDYDLKTVRCTKNDCSSKTFSVVDNGAGTTTQAGIYTSIQLDSNYYPVIAYAKGDESLGDFDLKLVHCNDFDCAGGDETINILDGQGSGSECASATGSDCDSSGVAWYNKLRLDSNGYPVIAYRSQTAGDLKLIHCNDANCAGNNDSIVRIDGCTGCNDDGSSATEGAGGYASLQLDSNGYPVVSYRKVSSTENNTLKLVHCGNADCSPTGSGQTDPTSFRQVRSVSFSPSTTAGDTTRTFTVKLWVTSGAATIKSARLRIIQSGTSLTAAQTQVEIGGNESVSATTYTELTTPKYYTYASSAYDGTVTGSFEATMNSGKGYGRLWGSGFELGSATAGVEVTAVSGSPSITSSTVRSGTYAMQMSPSSGTSYFSSLFQAPGSANVYGRAYIRFSTLPNSTIPIMILASTTLTANYGAIKYNSSTGFLELHVCTNAACTSSTLIGADTNTIATGTWYRVELHVDGTTTSGTHTVTGKLNGTTFATSSAQTLASAGRIFVGAMGTTTTTMFVDDVAVNDSTGSWAGPGHIIHLKPNAVGDNNAWAIGAGSGSNYEQVDEAVPDDATTYLSSNTAGATEDFNIEASGLASGDDINTVAVGVRYRGAGASSNASFITRVKASSTSSIGSSSDITPSDTTWVTNSSLLYPSTIYDMPGSNLTQWSATELDGAQIGVRVSSASTNAVNVSTVWLQVDYTAESELEGGSVQLETCSSSSDCTQSGNWSAVSGTALTYGNPIMMRKVASSAVTLTNGNIYRVTTKRSNDSWSPTLANAKLVVNQSSMTGISLTESQFLMVNASETDTDSTYTSQEAYMSYVPNEFASVSTTTYYEAVLKTSAGTGYVNLYNYDSSTEASNSELNSSSTSFTIQRSGNISSSLPSSATNILDTQIKNSASNTTTLAMSWMIFRFTVAQTADSTPAPGPAPSTGNAGEPNRNYYTGWAYPIMAGPNFIGTPAYIPGVDEAGDAFTFIANSAHHDDLHIRITRILPYTLKELTPKIPLPWEQGFQTVSEIYLFQAYSAFNGYPIESFDNPVSIVLPYQKYKLGKTSSSRLRITWYDKRSKRWKQLSNNTVLNEFASNIANTTKNYGYFAVTAAAPARKKVLGVTMNGWEWIEVDEETGEQVQSSDQATEDSTTTPMVPEDLPSMIPNEVVGTENDAFVPLKNKPTYIINKKNKGTSDILESEPDATLDQSCLLWKFWCK